MKIFTVHIKPGSPDTLENAIFVKEGFSLPAFIFHAFWAVYHRIWWLVAAVVVVDSFFYTLADEGFISHTSYVLARLGFYTILGLNGADWYSEALRKRGYIISDIVSAKSLDEAQHRFFSRYTQKWGNGINPTEAAAAL